MFCHSLLFIQIDNRQICLTNTGGSLKTALAQNALSVSSEKSVTQHVVSGRQGLHVFFTVMPLIQLSFCRRVEACQVGSL